MRIDAHQHFWIFNPVRDSWIDDSMLVIRKDFLPKDLKPILKANNIDGCIAVQADQSEKETNFLLECALNNPFIKGVVGWIDLCNENVEERLKHFTQNKLFKGVRHIVQAETEDFVLRNDFLNGISKLSKYNLVYDILVFPNQLENVIKMVAKFPEQEFVLDHIAKPKISEGLIANTNWKTNIKRLASYKNVSCKVSGMITETQDFKWEEKDFYEFLNVVVEAFGTDRLLFGSDWPVCLLAGEYQDVLQIIEQYFSAFSKEDVSKIMGDNAARIYKLNN
ncbi:amidohydrolase family protein [Neotamlana laminarinivorans]|uniref:Amidohydrolase family protein n=1 Tax=Neotamlana laminarinivorans TaxID=2883124 RepID=A0A9X1L2D1_9FLAO|nr:amidohydrolase family protein [Tamlana laminarinivorans]MCB4799663.1 amidohydrolase family protein [Tamlana laminarinivorans]